MMKIPSISLVCITLFALAGCGNSNSEQAMENKESKEEVDENKEIVRSPQDNPSEKEIGEGEGTQIATFGGGCFWCTKRRLD